MLSDRDSGLLRREQEDHYYQLATGVWSKIKQKVPEEHLLFIGYCVTSFY